MTPQNDKLTYTLGKSTRSLEEFIGFLKRHGIEMVVDVRRFPSSRFEYFCGGKLAELLDEAGTGRVPQRRLPDLHHYN